MMLFSIGRAHHIEGTEFLRKQVLWTAIASVALWITTCLRLEKLRSASWIIGLASVGILALVLVPGVGLKINGARRWIDLGPMNMQVSDFAKLGFLFFFAHYLASQQRVLGSFFKGFLFPIGMIGLVCGLLFLQPDFGTAALFGVVGGILLFLAGCRLKFLIPSLFAAIALFSLLVLRDPIRLARITSFLDLEGTRQTGGYQLWQALLGFATGGPMGVGLGNSRQPLSFLPEAHTDFIFAVVGEELGLIFTALTVLAFMAFFVIVLLQLRKAPQMFDFLLASGALLFIVLQALINVGVVTGLLPTKGMSLPFVSYGGSNLVAMGVLVGLILNLISEWNKDLAMEAGEITR
jgi:cell division protein FtsW|tara:strand:+ start:61754 stop:62803 length:1050 start_codon:yes stop_codon:yes gene_type:complete